MVRCDAASPWFIDTVAVNLDLLLRRHGDRRDIQLVDTLMLRMVV